MPVPETAYFERPLRPVMPGPGLWIVRDRAAGSVTRARDEAWGETQGGKSE
jgi:hypothetical protein